MKQLGALGEQLVEERYRKLGYKLLEKNYIFPRGVQIGELDLIFTKGQEIIFVEVKTRSSGLYGTAFEAVDTNKQRKLIKTAKLYLHLHKQFASFDYRIDVAAVDIDNHENPVIILE